MHGCSARRIPLVGVGMHAHIVSVRLSSKSTVVTPCRRPHIRDRALGVTGMGLVRIEIRLGAVNLPAVVSD